MRSPVTAFVLALVLVAACAKSGKVAPAPRPASGPAPAAMDPRTTAPPNPDPRVGLKAGLFDAGEASWNLRVVSKTPKPEKFDEAGFNLQLAINVPVSALFALPIPQLVEKHRPRSDRWQWRWP